MRYTVWTATLMTSAAMLSATLAAPTARAQDDTTLSSAPIRSPAIDSTIYMKAFDMVSNGDPEGGRELIDSLLKASTEGTPKYAEGLYWRARLASMGPNAERDYRRIIVDYPLTSRASDALLKLGQLELTRGDRDAAEGHFKRIISDYESSSVYAEANYWLARSYFDMNKMRSACKVNAEALAKVSPTNIELKNQIDFQNQQCRGLAVVDDTAAVADAQGTEKPTKPAKKLTAAQKAAVAKAEKAEKAKAAKSKKEVPVVNESHDEGDVAMVPANSDSENDSADQAPKDSVAIAVDPAMGENEGDEAPPVKKPVKAVAKGATKPTVAAKGAVKGATKTTAKPEPAAATTATGKKPVYMVQVAAYQTKELAAEMAATLKARGYTAHVDGTKAPFRVRIGRFTTHAGAADLLAKLRENQVAMDAFVTQD